MGGGGKGGGGKGGKKGGGGGGLPPIKVEMQGVFDVDTNSVLKADTNSVLKADTNIALKADTNSVLKADTNSALKADTNSALKAEVDLKPLQLDLCLKLGLDRLPSTSVCRDASRHFGITLFGVRVIGFDYLADSKTVIEDLGQRPFVVGKRPEHHHGLGVQGIRIRVGD